jgi:hypothetical protein
VGKKKGEFYLDDVNEDELDGLDHYSDVDNYIFDHSDIDEPSCGFCGSTTWEFCRLGEGNIIAECSDCQTNGRH